MNRIYLVSGDNLLALQACKKALENMFPSQTFDAETIVGVSGVRIHVEIYDLMDPMVKECRDYAFGFMAGWDAALSP